MNIKKSLLGASALLTLFACGKPSEFNGGQMTMPSLDPQIDAATTSHIIKWHPGHYMGSGLSLKNDGRDINASGVSLELKDLAKYSGMKGYLVYVYWAHIEPSENVYNFSVLDATLAQLKAQGKRFAIHISLGPFTGGNPYPKSGDYRFIPKYILTNPKTYGTSLPGGDKNGYGGYWGAQTGGYFANLANPNVLKRVAALYHAVGSHYDKDPNFEAFVAVNETSNMSPLRSAGVSAQTFLASVEAIASYAVAAFPHTSVIAQNTWTGTIQTSYDLQGWMYHNRVAAGSPDTFGATGFEKYSLDKPGGSLAWGLQALFGLADAGIKGVTDYRSHSPSMVEVQAGDMGVYQRLATHDGGPYSPADIAVATQKFYKSSHVFWTHFYGNEQSPFPSGVVWNQLAPTVLKYPLVNTGYPANYP